PIGSASRRAIRIASMIAFMIAFMGQLPRVRSVNRAELWRGRDLARPAHSQLRADRALDRADRVLVAPVEGPLLDALGAQQAGLGQHLQMLAHGRLADAELLGDQHAANAVARQVAVDLRRKMPLWLLQPFEDLEA